MANRDRQTLKNCIKVTLGLGTLLGLGALNGAANSSHEKNIAKQKAAKKNELEQELATVRHKITNLRSGFLGSVINSEEISRLERREREIVNQLKNL